MTATLEAWRDQAMRQRKKLGMLALLLTVSLLLWGRALWDQPPQSASATAMAQDASDVLLNGELPQFDAEPRRAVVPVIVPSRMPRNLFGFDPNRYSRTEIPGIASGAQKPDPSQVDEPTHAERVRQLAEQLKLDSVVRGDKPHALINGVLVPPGGDVEGFTLRKVNARSVELEMDGVVVQLRM